MSAREDDAMVRLRHSTAHVMAEAVGKLFPTAQFGIGPAIDEGFYYDFDLPRPLTPDDLEQIEALMRDSIRADTPFVRQELSPDQARQTFAQQALKRGQIPAVETDTGMLPIIVNTTVLSVCVGFPIPLRLVHGFQLCRIHGPDG